MFGDFPGLSLCSQCDSLSSTPKSAAIGEEVEGLEARQLSFSTHPLRSFAVLWRINRIRDEIGRSAGETELRILSIKDERSGFVRIYNAKSERIPI